MKLLISHRWPLKNLSDMEPMSRLTEVYQLTLLDNLYSKLPILIDHFYSTYLFKTHSLTLF